MKNEHKRRSTAETKRDVEYYEKKIFGRVGKTNLIDNLKKQERIRASRKPTLVEKIHEYIEEKKEILSQHVPGFDRKCLVLMSKRICA